MKWLIATIYTGIVLSAAVEFGRAQEEEISLQDLRASFESAVASTEEPLAAFEKKYLESLEKLAGKVQSEGKLSEVLKVREEIETFHTDDEREYREFPELRRLREIYDQQKERLSAQILPEQHRVFQKYATALESFKRAKTKEGDIDLAVAANEELKRLTELRHDLEAGMKAANLTGFTSQEVKPDWSLTSRGDYVMHGEVIIEEREDGSMLLTKGRGINVRLNTNRDFSPPFRLVAEVNPTTSSSIRFLFCETFLVQFNAGGDKSAILYCGQEANKQFAGKGKIPPGDFAKVEVIVRADEAEVFLNGESCGTLEADFGKLRGRVGISPFRDCPVIIRNFAVYKLGTEE